jgi:hypothetical protein
VGSSLRIIIHFEHGEWNGKPENLSRLLLPQAYPSRCWSMCSELTDKDMLYVAYAPAWQCICVAHWYDNRDHRECQQPIWQTQETVPPNGLAMQLSACIHSSLFECKLFDRHSLAYLFNTVDCACLSRVGCVWSANFRSPSWMFRAISISTWNYSFLNHVVRLCASVSSSVTTV